MNRTELEQKSLFKKEVFKVTETGLEVYLKDYEGVFNRFYHFDDFSRRTNRAFTETKPKFLRIGIAMLIATPLIFKALLMVEEDYETVAFYSSLITALFGLFFIAYFFLSRKQNFLLEMDNDEQVFILMDKPNKKEVEEFIDAFYKKRNEYYREKYFNIDFKGKRAEQVDRVKWLKDEDIISKNEYEDAMNKINNAWT